MFRRRPSGPEVLLVHPGGPFWAKKDDGAWSIPKGLREEGEAAEVAARREFYEETGCVPDVDLILLGEFRQAGGKRVEAFALEGDFDLGGFKSNLFEMEWPPHSGKRRVFPEADRAGWFSIEAARSKILKSQQPILGALEEVI
ncbi:putative NUDIX family NTP pyrophosphohydrolase [Rhodopseudomonas julia]|uniref:NUDIX family NTP pyrophosphohydrolase n=2 Tax=Rhodopseudomonas julia TaxID=200617 RepID=A0ABU0C981_9BRAD|nr:putative NUDIX family NTP pyrophosphohydrolase [Rhodopseudomonas julia]